MRPSSLSARPLPKAAARRAFTLIEMLLVVVVLGIAGALVIPAMGQVHVLRVQAALRTIVSDITFAQSDAIAFQERRALVFDTANNRYRIIAIPGSSIEETNTLFLPGGPAGRYVVDMADEKFAGATLQAADFDGDAVLIFDDMGAPVRDASGDTPSLGGVIRLQGSGQTYEIVVEPFTGRVTVRRIGA